MDWPRYLRAREAGQMEELETRRQSNINGDLPSDKISPEEWAQIQEHNRLLEM